MSACWGPQRAGERAFVRFESTPQGATVTLDERMLGTTACSAAPEDALEDLVDVAQVVVGREACLDLLARHLAEQLFVVEQRLLEGHALLEELHRVALHHAVRGL